MPRADELYNLGRYQDALTEYLKILKNDPEDVAAACMVANCNTNLGNYDEALRMAKTAVAMEPTYDFAHRTAAIAHQNLGHEKEAEKHYREAVRLDPQDYLNHTYLGSFLADKRKYKDAIVALEHARRLNPIAPEPLQALSEVYGETGDYERSLQLAIEALQLNPDESDSHLALGLSHLAKGDNESAEKHISEALRINPNNPRAEHALREAIRAKFPLFRSLMRQSRWIRSKGQGLQTALWFGGYVVARVTGQQLIKNPATKPIGIAIIASWVLLVVYVTVTPVMANIALLRHPLGKFALKKPQRTASYIIFGFVAYWILEALLALIVRGLNPAGIVTIFGLLFTVGASIFYKSRENQRDVHTIAGMICGLGVVICSMFFFVT